jgi:sugar porter (SP) family MFS transporter
MYSSQEKPAEIARPVLHCVLMSLLSGMVYGYTTGIVAGIHEPAVNHMFDIFSVTPDMNNANNWTCTSTNPNKLSPKQLSVFYGIFTADILLGNLIGAYLGPWTAEKFGARRATLFNGVCCIVSSVRMYLIPTFGLQVVLRVVQGISIGYCATVGPSYVSEISPPSQRGQLGTLFQLFICGFMAFGMLINILFNPSNIIQCLPGVRWRLQLGLAAVPGSLLFLYALVWMPESPKWLVKQSAAHQSNENSSLIDNDFTSSGVLGTIDENNSFVTSSEPRSHFGSGGGGQERGGWSLMFSRRGFKWLIIVITLPMAQQLTGINAIMFYGPTIIANMGFENSLIVTFLVVGIWNLLSVFVSFVLVDRLGRRVLMLGSLMLMGIATVVMGILFHAFKLGDPALPKFIPLSMIMLFILAFESGPGPLFFVILNEVFPKTIRNEAISLANMLQSGMNIALSMSFPVLIVALGDVGKQKNGTGTTFFILTGFVVLSALLVWAFVPESAATIETDINNDNAITNKISRPDSMNERLEFQGKKRVGQGIIDTPAGVHWTPTQVKPQL